MWLATMRGGGRCPMSAQQLQPGSRRSRERALHDDLRAGIGRGELLPFYQQIVSVRHRSVLRLEVLARWQHPERGFLQAPEFIPIAERSGLMPALTETLLEVAVADFRVRRANDPGLRLSINLSAHSLRDPHLAEMVTRRLAAVGGSPDWLAFE